MSAPSKAPVLLSLVLGLLLGAVILMLTAYSTGFINWDSDGAASDQSFSETQGTDWLQNYRCAKGETKEVIIRGLEDHYSPEGEENVPLSDYVQTVSEKGSTELAIRHYDDNSQDKFLYENFHKK